MKAIIDLIGRILLGFIFIYDAIDSMIYFQETKQTMIEYGLTWRPNLLLIGGIFILLLGGTLLLTGYRARFGITLLLLYWIPVTFLAHDFWMHEEPQRRIEAIFFMKNIAIMGGMLMVWANGTGRYSIRRLLATTRVRE